MYCPIHHYVRDTDIDEVCPKCHALCQLAIECELDKIGRVMDTLHEQGYEILPCSDGTKAILVFRIPKSEVAEEER